MVKRLFALVLCTLMALSALPAAALTEGEPAAEKGETRLHESYFNDSDSNTYFTFVDSNIPWLDKSGTDNYGFTTKYIESGNSGVNSSRSTISTTSVHMEAGEWVSFLYWCITEEGHDFFRFYVNGSKVYERSGLMQNWLSYIYTIPQDGDYTFKWEYEKDASSGYSYDCVRLKKLAFSRCANLERERAVLAPGGGGLMLSDPAEGVYSFNTASDNGDHTFYVSSSNWHIGNSIARIEASGMVPSDPAVDHYISFDYKVESERDLDYLIFKIDGRNICTWSGTDDYTWKHYSWKLTPGLHIFTWEYVKDVSDDEGRDRACLDNITLVNYDNAQDRFTGMQKALSPYNDVDIIFNTPAGSAGFCSTQIAPCSNNRYINSSTSCFEAKISMRQGETLSFDYLVSSESYDRFRFIADGQVMLTDSGWERPQVKSHTFTANETKTYNFRWEYVKDGSLSKGYDMAFVFNILYNGTFHNWDSDDFDDVVNDPDTDEYLHYVGGVGAGGWFTPYYTAGWDAAVSSNKFYEGTSCSFGAGCYMNVGDRLSFEYMVDSEDGGDFFHFIVSRRDGSYYDTEEEFYESGQISWDDYTFICETAGEYWFGWAYEKDYSIDSRDDIVMIDNVRVTRSNELDRALNPEWMDQSDWIHFESDGQYTFIPCDFNGRYCAKSGNTGYGSTTSQLTAEVYVPSPDRISFDYYINCEANYDYMVFFVNGTEVQRFSGRDSTAWQTFTTSGSYSGPLQLEWKYVKDGNLSYGTDTAALDNVRIGDGGMLGDVDGNGNVDTTDALYALRQALGIMELPADQRQRADVNGDGIIDTTDALYILRYALGIISHF